MFPVIAARMKQRNDGPRLRIYSCEIRPFSLIAAVASPCQIVQGGAASVLARDDVFKMKSQRFRQNIWRMTILALARGPVPYILSLPLASHETSGNPSLARARSCARPMNSLASIKLSYSARSSDVRVPSLDFSANSSRRFFAEESSSRFAIAERLLASKHAATLLARLSNRGGDATELI